jgi:transcriptional regulator with XRE-family HTH domain
VSPATAVEDKYDSPDFQKSLQSTAEHVDNHVGQRLRLRRQELGQSQTAVADRLEVTFKQVQHYARGMNRISADQLHNICGVLDVPVGYFFKGLEADSKDLNGLGLNDSGIMKLVDHYMLISGHVTRARLCAMLRAVGRRVG